MNNHIPKPEWLKVKLGDSLLYGKTSSLINNNCINTICVSGKCPNHGECWSRGRASFMIGGDICTRNCKFCNTNTGKPLPLDLSEPLNLANTIKSMNLTHVVVTSVDRDDLADGGAEHWVNTVNEIKRLNPGITLELLIPDFNGLFPLIDSICNTEPDIISHNIETVESLTPYIRSKATYKRSLEVLNRINSNKIITKSGFMLGLGENKAEILNTILDLKNAGCSILTIGQYLQPSKKNIEVKRYVSPKEFLEYKDFAISNGFNIVESAPLVRSSYYAENHLLKR
ncbi:MAG: lipoyl synthase [Bacteroidales bacterium]|nr:lipoyl synthase [Bacteroidales bacterium]